MIAVANIINKKLS